MIVDGINFQGVGKVPQIEIVNNDLIQRKTTLNHSCLTRMEKIHSWIIWELFFKGCESYGETYCLETQIGDVSILSVNLSMRRKTRLQQLDFIERMIERNIQRKYLIVGDFNVKRESELFPLFKSCGLFELGLNNSKGKNKNRFFRILYHNDIRVVGLNIIDCDFSKNGVVVFDF